MAARDGTQNGACFAGASQLLDDFERSALAVTCSRTGKQCTNRLNRLTVSSDYPANIGLPKLQSEHRRFPAGNFGQHHLVRKLHQLPDYEFEEFFHEFTCSGGLLVTP